MQKLTLAVLVVVFGCGLGSSAAWSAPAKAHVPHTAAAAEVAAAPEAPVAACDSHVPARLPKHVFLIVLENENYETSFGESSAGLYPKELADQGVLLTNYYGIGHNSLDNYIAMISGQAPNKATQADCPWFIDFQPLLKTGCVYPKHVLTIADQLDHRSQPLAWAAYLDAMPKNCSHPKIGKWDDTRKGPYAARHNPFVYFHSLVDSGSCDQHDRPLGNIDGSAAGLVRDLQAGQVPAFVFIAPDLCNDGHDDKECPDDLGKLKRVDRFLRDWVPILQKSAAYQDDGMLVITFDEAEVHLGADKATSKRNAQASTACCNEQPGPGADDPGLFGPGGGRVGAVILSPLVVPKTENAHEFNHYSLLRSIQDMFQVGHLGFAGQENLRTFQECGVFKADPPAVVGQPQL